MKAKRADPYDVNVMRPILEAEEIEGDDKPLELMTPALKQYIDDLREIQIKDKQENS